MARVYPCKTGIEKRLLTWPARVFAAARSQMCLAYIECLHLDGARSCAERPVCAQGVEIYTRLPARFVTGPLELVSPKSASARSWIAETVARVALPFWLSFPARAALVSPSALVRPSATDKRVFFPFFSEPCALEAGEGAPRARFVRLSVTASNSQGPQRACRVYCN